MTPRDVIAKWLWSEVDLYDFDDMGGAASDGLIARLDGAGYRIVKVTREEAKPFTLDDN